MLAGLDVGAASEASSETPIQALHLQELEAGFHLLYELKPQEARKQFEAWQRFHAEDPLWSASEATSYLFEECYWLGILTSELFLNDNRFLGKIPLKPDQQIRAATTSGRSRISCWRWRPCARKSRKWPAYSSQNSLRNFRKSAFFQ